MDAKMEMVPQGAGRKDKNFQGPTIELTLEPCGGVKKWPRPKTARQLLESLGIGEEGALVAREGELLTPDRRIWPEDRILVRQVGSRG